MSNIPNYKDFVLPFLKILNDGEIHTLDGIINDLINFFKLSEAERNELVKCGRQYTYKNRIIMARTYLVRCGFIQLDRERKMSITNKGKQFIGE